MNTKEPSELLPNMLTLSKASFQTCFPQLDIASSCGSTLLFSWYGSPPDYWRHTRLTVAMISHPLSWVDVVCCTIKKSIFTFKSLAAYFHESFQGKLWRQMARRDRWNHRPELGGKIPELKPPLHPPNILAIVQSSLSYHFIEILTHS